MNYKNLFQQLKKYKIKDAEYHCLFQTSFSFTLLKNEIINYTTNATRSININTVINDKLVTVSTDNINKQNINNLINHLLETSKYINKKNAYIYKQKETYAKYNFYNNNLNNIDERKKIQLIFDIEKQIKNYSPFINNIEINYSENSIKHEYHNTANINLKSKTNFFCIETCIVVKKNTINKTGFLEFSDNDLTKFDIKKYVQQICEQTLKKIDNISISTGLYEVIFDSKVTAILLDYYVAQLNAEKIRKNISWFKNKIKTQVANNQVTIMDKPLEKNINFTAYDSQGVPTYNQILIKNGILQTYLHNLETAHFFHVKPPGHAVLINSKIDIQAHNIHLQGGDIEKNDIITTIKKGVYITDIEGLHAGMNIESGNFSLKAEGYYIQNGQINKFIDMMTINANLYEIFCNIKKISKEYEFTHNNYAPCIYLNNIAISC